MSLKERGEVFEEVYHLRSSMARFEIDRLLQICVFGLSVLARV
jgi:hypothetical protein